MLHRAALAIIGTVALAAPAAAAATIEIPEPSDPSLFALGVVGLLVGRWVARRKPRS